jgi:two-component system, NarL family, nitrate/nitrite response regulator NarL
MPIRLVLADDHPIVLDGLAQLFGSERDFDVVARAADGDEALAAVRRHRPDVLVLDLRMPRKDGLAVIRELRSEGLSPRVVVLTASRESGDVFEAINLGVEGVVLKDMATSLLVRCVREVHAGRKWIERGAASDAVDALRGRQSKQRNLEAILTPRELQVARLTAKGHPNKVVAERLSITEGTAKLHLHHVYEKLAIDGRMALVQYMQGRGLL